MSTSDFEPKRINRLASAKYFNETLYFASNASATIPAARGAAAEVPVWSMVHWSFKSVVAYKHEISNWDYPNQVDVPTIFWS